jgi:hypothetical protein
MDPTYYANSAEAKALHAVIDEDDDELKRVLRELLPWERRQLARQARILADACEELG